MHSCLAASQERRGLSIKEEIDRRFFMKELKIRCMVYADLQEGQNPATVLGQVVQDINGLNYSINIFEVTQQECEE